MAKHALSTTHETTAQELRKHVSTIHTSGELSLLERKLVNVLLLNAYDNLLTNEKHTIPVSILCTMLGWHASNDIDSLKKALTNIQKTLIQFDLLNDSKKRWTSMSLISLAEIEQGVCSYRYVPELAQKMANPEIYATINIGVQNKFAGGYSLTLYENVVRFKRVGSTGWLPVDLWRKMLGAEAPNYNEFKRFSGKVINKAVEEINQVSDIEIAPEYNRKARKVTEIRFRVKENPQKSIFDASALDGNDHIRQSKIYQRLIDHGIGDKLAIAWVLQESDEKISMTIDYVEEQDRRNLVKGTTSGYIRTLIESKANIGESSYKKKKRELAEQANAAKSAMAAGDELDMAHSKRIDAAIKALSTEEIQAFATKYFDSEGAGCEKYYNREKASFKNAIERVKFTAWLRPQIAKDFKS